MCGIIIYAFSSMRLKCEVSKIDTFLAHFIYVLHTDKLLDKYIDLEEWNKFYYKSH